MWIPSKETAHAAIVGVGRGEASTTDPSIPILYSGIKQGSCLNYLNAPQELPEDWDFLPKESKKPHWPGSSDPWLFLYKKWEMRSRWLWVWSKIQDLRKSSTVWGRKYGMLSPPWTFLTGIIGVLICPPGSSPSRTRQVRREVRGCPPHTTTFSPTFGMRSTSNTFVALYKCI